MYLYLYLYIYFNGNDLEMASKMHWASGKIIMLHQCKTCTLLNRPLQKNTISSCSSVKLLFKYLTSHMIEHKLSDCRTNGTDGSSDCHRHTCGLLWFHTFPVFLHLNLYSNKTNSINKKDQLFSQKKKNAMITIEGQGKTTIK